MFVVTHVNRAHLLDILLHYIIQNFIIQKFSRSWKIQERKRDRDLNEIFL